MRRLLERPPALADQAPVMCQDCGQWWAVDPEARDPWRCACGRLAAWGCQPGTCRACDRPTTVIRHGHDVSRNTCDCHLSPQQKREVAQQERRWRDRAQRDREWEDAKQQQAQDRAREQQEAKRCLATRGGTCDEDRPPRHPYAMCLECRVNRT